MPLKLIYQASPLMTPKSLPLRAGSFRCRSPWLADLYRQALPHAEASELWEGLIRLGEAVDGTGRSNAAAEKAQEAAASLNRGEAWPWQGQQALQVARAIWALYEIKPERSLLEAMMRYVSQLPGAWKALQSDAPADLLELLEQLYRVTGKPALLTLCRRIRKEMPDWGSILRTWSIHRPADPEEKPSENAAYARLIRCMTHGETLADGLRAATFGSLCSGSGLEADSPRIAWDRIMRHHGAVGGGFTADPLVAGSSPYAGQQIACLGAQAEALAAQVYTARDDWALDALEVLWTNALPAAVAAGIPVRQRANTHRGSQEQPTQEERLHALARLTRGCAAAAAVLVTADADGLRLNAMVPGRYGVETAKGTVLLTVTRQDDAHCSLRLEMKQPLHTQLRLRVPEWMQLQALTLNSQPLACPKSRAAALQRVWQSGDTLCLSWRLQPRLQEGYHHGVCVFLGPQLLCLPTEEERLPAVIGEPRMEGGTVTVELASIAEEAAGKDVPVLPAHVGDSRSCTLAPYAETAGRIAFFPRGGSK